MHCREDADADFLVAVAGHVKEASPEALVFLTGGNMSLGRHHKPVEKVFLLSGPKGMSVYYHIDSAHTSPKQDMLAARCFLYRDARDGPMHAVAEDQQIRQEERHSPRAIFALPDGVAMCFQSAQ